jgi:ACS family tartrate transporter-like MFS transporter
MSIELPTALDRARAKAYRRLIPLLFFCYMIAYVDRTNVAIASLTMPNDLPGFDNAVFGFGSGVFFIGYFLLEIPGTLLVEKWSARKWISRIMISWGIMAGVTAMVKTPFQFYSVRFLLGLAEAGFFPGVIVYLTHWFPSRDRARALAYFFIATPIAQMVSPRLSYYLVRLGTSEKINGQLFHYPAIAGLHGWQWLYIAWGIPAVVLGIMVFFLLTDRPAQARWLEADERNALELELKREKEIHQGNNRHMRVVEALRHPKVILLAAAYFFIVTGNYGIEFFLPKILKDWYALEINAVTWLVVLPPIGALVGQMVVGWSSDRTKERRFHAVVPIYIGAILLACTPSSQGHLWLTVALFMGAVTGAKAYMPAFWSLPSLFLTEAAAAGSVGLINSVGNLGGFVGPFILGKVQQLTGSFQGGIYYLSISMAVSGTIILLLGLGHRETKPGPKESLAELV